MDVQEELAFIEMTLIESVDPLKMGDVVRFRVGDRVLTRTILAVREKRPKSDSYMSYRKSRVPVLFADATCPFDNWVENPRGAPTDERVYWVDTVHGAGSWLRLHQLERVGNDGG